MTEAAAGSVNRCDARSVLHRDRASPRTPYRRKYGDTAPSWIAGIPPEIAVEETPGIREPTVALGDGRRRIFR